MVFKSLKLFSTIIALALSTHALAESDCDAETMIDAVFDQKDTGFADIKRCLELGMDPNIADADGETLLNFAAWRDEVQLVEILLDAGADPNLENAKGQTALFTTIQGNCRPTTGNLMMDRGAVLSANAPFWVKMAKDTAGWMCKDDAQETNYLKRLLATAD